MFGGIGAVSQGQGAGGGSLGRPLRVVVVEDELIIGWELSEMLTELGHEVCGLAADAGEAIALAERTEPDLVLMDVWLRRGEDGIAAAEAIQKARPVHVVFVSAYGSDPVIRARMEAANAVGILSKPILLDDLRRALARLPPSARG